MICREIVRKVVTAVAMVSACMCAAIHLTGCVSKEQKIAALEARIPEAILPDARNVDVHFYNMDADIHIIEYVTSSTQQSAVISQIKSRFSDQWKTVEDTSDTLQFARTLNRKSYDIEAEVTVYVSTEGRVLVMYAGLDSPAEEAFYASRSKPYFQKLQKRLEAQ